MVDKLRIFNFDDPADVNAFDEMIGVDRSQIKSTATCRHLGNAEVEYRYSCGHVIRDVAKDKYGQRDEFLAETLVSLAGDGIPLDCPKCE